MKTHQDLGPQDQDAALIQDILDFVLELHYAPASVCSGLFPAKKFEAGDIAATGSRLGARRRDHGRGSLRMGSQESKSRLNRECACCHYPDKAGGPCPSPMAGCTAIS